MTQVKYFQKLKCDEGNLKLENEQRYFIQESLGKCKKHTKLFLSNRLREQIKGCVNEEQFSSTIVINQEELESKVDFIMSFIADTILNKDYAIIKIK